MAAVSQKVTNLLGGVSQQPDPVKLAGQVSEAINVLLDPTFGCKKRPPTQYIGEMYTEEEGDGHPIWHPIFRDSNERYITSMYRNSAGNTQVRVFEAQTGIERTVNIDPKSQSYLDAGTIDDLNQLTINDYTIISNKAVQCDMSQATGDDQNPIQEALVVINQVAYNTTYNVDFLRDGEELQKVEVYRATELAVTPSYFKEPGDTCEFATSANFIEDSGADKQDLAFTLTTQCSPTQTTVNSAGADYPVKAGGLVNARILAATDADYGFQAWAQDKLGDPSTKGVGGYENIYLTHTFPAGTVTVRVEVRVLEVQFDDGKDGDLNEQVNRYGLSNVFIQNYTIDRSNSNTNEEDELINRWQTGLVFYDVNTTTQEMKVLFGENIGKPNGTSYPKGSGKPDERANRTVVPSGSKVGFGIEILTVSQGDDNINYDVASNYRSSVTLKNGGRGWRKGDVVVVNMAGRDYTIEVTDDDFSFEYQAEANASFTTPVDTSSGQLNIGAITGGLTDEINALPNYDAEPVGNVVRIQRTDGRNFNIQTRGGSANQAMYGIKERVSDISKLPDQCFNGFRLMVNNTAESDADDYYVQFKSVRGEIPGSGSWEETHKQGIPTNYNYSSMPQVLIRESDGEFTLRPLSPVYDDEIYWIPREVGDENTNPKPSFVGSTITKMFFYMNRLGVLTGDKVVLSQPGDYFNFWQGSAIAIADSDPIDMGVSTTKPAILKDAIGTPKGLLMFAENSQFLLSTRDPAFGPSTVNMDEISGYAYKSNVSPIDSGVSIIFNTSALTYSKVFEMAVDSLENRPQVAENTRVIPEYITPDLTWGQASANNSFIAYGDGTGTAYIFKYYNVGNERNLAGWTKWQFAADIHLMEFDHDTAYNVQGHEKTEASGVYTYFLTKFEMNDDPKIAGIEAYGQNFLPRIDNLLSFENFTVQDTEDLDIKRIDLPGSFYINGSVVCLIAPTPTTNYRYFTPTWDEDNSVWYIMVEADLVEDRFFLGLLYNMSVTLPSFFLKQDNQADRHNIPIVENVYLDVYLSGHYKAFLQRTGYDTQMVQVDVMRADVYLADDAAMARLDAFQIPVYSRGDICTVTCTAEDPLPSAITGYSWEGHYNNRGISFVK